MARKLVSLAQYEMQAAANKGGAKEMYNNSGWSSRAICKARFNPIWRQPTTP